MSEPENPGSSSEAKRRDPRRVLLPAGGTAVAIIAGATAALAEWREGMWVVEGVAAVAAATVLVLLIFLQRLSGEVAEATAALRRSEADTQHHAVMLSTLIENLPVGVTLVGADMRYRAFNRRFLEMFNLGPDMLKVGDRYGKLVRATAVRGDYGPGDVETLVRGRLEQILSPDWTQTERMLPDNRVIDIRRIALPEGGYVTTYIDVTDRRILESQLLQAQKMEAIGQLSGGVAHDFNNLLAVVIGNLDNALDEARDKPALSGSINKALDAARRGAELVRRLLAFARNQPLRPQLLDLGTAVRAMEPLLRRTLGERIVIDTRLPEKLWPAMADPTQFDNTVLNLAINARDAMPDGGRLTLTGANIALDDAAAASVDLPPGDYVTLTVSDSGTGVAPELLHKVFEPFFTTKEVGKGTGLGLSMVYGYARQSGGTVKIYSEIGHGTDVRLYLPRAAATPVAPAAAEAPAALSRGQGRVLLVEDRADVREIATFLVESLGYQTIAAEDAAAALRVLDRGETFDLLFTDLVMPGTMNGVDLAREVRRRDPAIAIVFTSGFSDPQAILADATALDASVLGKPYRKSELSEHLRAALDRRKRH